MLNNKDYCDYETCVALWSMGLIPHPYDNTDTDKVMAIISLYEAQKWLREEKNIIVLVGFDFCPVISEIVYNWVIVVNGNTAKKSSYTYDYFEEALSEGIKEAIKILKEKSNMEECKCKPAKSFAQRIIEYQEFASLVKSMRDAQKELDTCSIGDYAFGQHCAAQLESEVDEYLKKMEE